MGGLEAAGPLVPGAGGGGTEPAALLGPPPSPWCCSAVATEMGLGTSRRGTVVAGGTLNHGPIETVFSAWALEVTPGLCGGSLEDFRGGTVSGPVCSALRFLA